jgi:hypothetical protein
VKFNNKKDKIEKKMIICRGEDIIIWVEKNSRNCSINEL